MEKAKFNNEVFYWFLIILFGGFLIWNMVNLIITGSLLIMLPLIIGFTLILLIVTNNKHSRIALIICSIIFFIVGSSLQLIGRFINDLLDNFEAFDLTYYIKAILTLTVGIIIYAFSKNTIEIEKINK